MPSPDQNNRVRSGSWFSPPLIMHLFRVADIGQATSPFAGPHCRTGGRWTSPGVHVAYTSLSAAGALLECLAHGIEPGATLVLVTALLPKQMAEPHPPLSEDWRALPYARHVRQIGDEWAGSLRSMALIVPSAIVPNEYNALINSEHPDFCCLEVSDVEPFVLDPRLVS